MKNIIWREDRRYKMILCFLPEQLISMADGTVKPIGEIELGEEIQVFKLNEEKLYHPNSVVWEDTNRIYANLNSNQIGKMETSIVKSIQHKLHSNVYELYLDNGKVLKPTGNHPIFTNKGWTTIDGHNPNHANGSGYLKVGDKVFDVNVNDWVSVVDIKSLDGEYKTINFIDTNTNTIIADGILTHNSAVPNSGGEEGIDHNLWKETDSVIEEASIQSISAGDKVLSFKFHEGDWEIISTEIIESTSQMTSGKVILKITAGSQTIHFTSTHIIPYYRNGELIEDIMGTLEVGDEVMVYNHSEGEVSKVAIDIINEELMETECEAIHPHTKNGYYFVNNILVEG
jgi:intein/homing endonuclease